MDPQPPNGYKPRTKFPTLKRQPQSRYGGGHLTSAAEIIAKQDAEAKKKARAQAKQREQTEPELEPEPETEAEGEAEVEAETEQARAGQDPTEEVIELPVHPIAPTLTGDAQLVSY